MKIKILNAKIKNKLAKQRDNSLQVSSRSALSEQFH